MWLVRANNPGIQALIDHGVLATDYNVRFDVSTLDRSAILHGAPNTAVWHLAPTNVRSRWAGELALFAGATAAGVDPGFQAGDLVVAAAGQSFLIGRLSGTYHYDDRVIEGHPHLWSVTWGQLIDAADCADAGLAIPKGRLTLQILNPSFEGIAFLASAAASPATSVEVRMRAPRSGDGRRREELERAAQEALRNLELPTGPVPAWVVEEDESAETLPCPEEARRCGRHTMYRFLYRSPRRVGVVGADLLIVALNPSCPDGPTNQTFINIAKLADDLGSRSVAVVNVLPIRNRKPKSAAAASLPREIRDMNRTTISRAIADATMVIAAYGSVRLPLGPRGERDWVIDRLESERVRRAVSICQVGDTPLHPSRWPNGARKLLQLWQPQ